MTAQTKVVSTDYELRRLLGAFAVDAMQGNFEALLDWARVAKIEFHDGAPVLAAPACAAEPGLKFAMYSDDDECMGDTIEEYVQNRTVDLTDELELQAGQEFYVDACYYRPEKWRLLERPTEANPNAIIRCERVDAPLFAAPPDFQAGLEMAAKIAEEEWTVFMAAKHAHERLSDEPFRPEAMGINYNAAIRAQQRGARIRAIAARKESP